MTESRHGEPEPDPQRLELKLSPMSPVLVWLGVPFVTVGIVVAFVALVREPFIMGDFLDSMAVSIILVLTGVFMGVGWWGYVLFDRRRGTVTKRWGSIVPLRRASRGLDGLSRVVVSGGEIPFLPSPRGFVGMMPVYSVRLEGKGPPFRLFAYDKYEPALGAAERVAEFLKLDLHDETREGHA